MKPIVRNILFIWLFITGLPISILLAQTPALTTLEPVVTKTYIYKETPSSTMTYQAKVVFFGMVNPNGGIDTVYFEFGLTTSYGGTVMAQPAIVEGNSPLQLNATAILNNCDQFNYCRIKVVSSTGTYYGSDLYFEPFIDDPTQKLIFLPTSNDPEKPSLQILNNSPIFDVSITCSDGTNSITQTIPSGGGTYSFTLNKHTSESIYINYTNPSGTITYPFFFRTIPSNDDLSTEPSSPINNIDITPSGYNISKDSTFFMIKNNNDVDVELTIITPIIQNTVIVPKNSPRFITQLGYGEYIFYYNNIVIGDFSAPLFLNRTLNNGFVLISQRSNFTLYSCQDNIILNSSASAITVQVIGDTYNCVAFSNQTWLIPLTTTYLSSHSLGFTVNANATGQDRTAIIEFSYIGGKSPYYPYDNVWNQKYITVKQYGSALPTSHLALHLSSDKGVVTLGPSVTEWDDISGNSNNALQSTGANQPKLVSSPMNGKPVIRFNGSTSKLTLPTSTTLGIQNNPYELFIVAKSNSSDIQFLMSGNTIEQYEYHINGFGARFIPITATYLDKGTTGTYSDGNTHVFSAHASASGGSVRVDGIDGGMSINNILSSNAGVLQLGVRSCDNSYYFNGDIAEVILYNAVLSSTDRNTVEQYLANRYGFAGGVLPVELTSFVAAATDGIVMLNWKTTTEVNNYGFEVQRSDNNNWVKIGFVQGYGNSNSPKNYSFTDNPTGGKKFQYRLKQIDPNEKFEYSNVVTVSFDVPANYAVAQNYPNPFNPTTVINYQLPVSGYVTLKVFDLLGREVATLINEEKVAGNYNVIFNGNTLSSGVYFYQLKSGSFVETKKLILMK